MSLALGCGVVSRHDACPSLWGAELCLAMMHVPRSGVWSCVSPLEELRLLSAQSSDMACLDIVQEAFSADFPVMLAKGTERERSNMIRNQFLGNTEVTKSLVHLAAFDDRTAQTEQIRIILRIWPAIVRRWGRLWATSP